MGLDNTPAVVSAESKRKQYVRESEELYANQSERDTDSTEEEEEEVEDEG